MKMPPKRSAGLQADEPANKKPCEKGTEEYVHRREKNNIAVRKSREKSRMKAKETTEKVTKLRAENEDLEQKVQILSKELKILKELFLSHAVTAKEVAGTANTAQPSQESNLNDSSDDILLNGPPTPVNTDALKKDHEYSIPSNSKDRVT